MVMLKQFAAGMLVVTVVMCASALGQATQPAATQPAVSDISTRPVGPSEGQRIETAPTNPMGQWTRTLGALALVVVLIFLARIMLKRFGPVSGRARRDVLDVLARSAVSPRHELLLVRVGRRVVLVGRSPSAMTTLSEITDRDEAAGLIESVLTGGLKQAAEKLTGPEGEE
jgi:flagellar biogenesis protein FliO